MGFKASVARSSFFHTSEISFWSKILALSFLFTELKHKPADLSERVIFKSKSKSKPIVGELASTETTTASVADERPGKSDNKSKKQAKETASKLSFAFEDDDDDDDEGND